MGLAFLDLNLQSHFLFDLWSMFAPAKKHVWGVPDAEFTNILSVLSALGEPSVELPDRIPKRRQDWIEAVKICP